MQDVLGQGLELLRRFDQPLQDRVRVDLKHARRAPDAQAFGQARDDAHDELGRQTLAMAERPERLEKGAAAGNAQQLPPGTATGVAIGAEIAPAHPAPIGTVRVGAAMRGGVDLTVAPSRGHDARWRGAGCLRVEVAGVRTGVAGRLFREARKGFGLTLALWQ